MSRHWQPPGGGKVVRGPWTRAEAYARKPRGRTPLLLIGAAALGVAAGGIWAWSDRAESVVVVPADAPAVVLPYDGPEAADVEWEQRGEGKNGPSTLRPGSGQASSGRTEEVRVPGARVSFGFCHSGGGRNCVVDGDTFYLGGEKVRIAGIDAPETHPPRCAYEAELGARATEQLHALLNAGAVTMTGIGRDRDTYGRLLRDVQVDGSDVDDAMIGAGVARAYGSGRRGWC